jgi:hypothetical protein
VSCIVSDYEPTFHVAKIWVGSFGGLGGRERTAAPQAPQSLGLLWRLVQTPLQQVSPDAHCISSVSYNGSHSEGCRMKGNAQCFRTCHNLWDWSEGQCRLLCNRSGLSRTSDRVLAVPRRCHFRRGHTAVPQVPQLPGLVWRFVHTPLQQVSPAAHYNVESQRHGMDKSRK